MKNFFKIAFLVVMMVFPLLAQQIPSENSILYASANELTDPEVLNTVPEVSVGAVLSVDKKNSLGSSNEIVVDKIYGFEYFPLKQNIQYAYDSNAGDTEAEVSEAENELILTYNAGSITYEQQFFKGDKGIYLTRTETSAFLFFGSKVTYPEPVLRLPLPLKDGATWQWVGLEIAGGDTGKLTITGEVIGEEVVETPVGNFQCLKISLQVDSEMGSRNTITEWLAPEIGVVKFHAKLDGSGITGFLQDLMGLDEITFDLTGIKENKI